MGNTRSLTDKPITKEIVEEDGKLIAAHLSTVVTDPNDPLAVQILDPNEYPSANATELDPLSVEDDPTPNEDLGSEQPEGQNEYQYVEVQGSDGGTFSLTFKGEETDAMNYNVTLPTFTAKLEALSTIGAGNVNVFTDGPGFVIEFINDLGEQNVPQLSARAELTGDDPIVFIDSWDGHTQY